MSQETFIVTAYGYAVRFHTNMIGDVYSLADEGEATVFTSRETAQSAIIKHGVHGAEIVPANQPQPALAK